MQLALLGAKILFMVAVRCFGGVYSSTPKNTWFSVVAHFYLDGCVMRQNVCACVLAHNSEHLHNIITPWKMRPLLIVGSIFSIITVHFDISMFSKEWASALEKHFFNRTAQAHTTNTVLAIVNENYRDECCIFIFLNDLDMGRPDHLTVQILIYVIIMKISGRHSL